MILKGKLLQYLENIFVSPCLLAAFCDNYDIRTFLQTNDLFLDTSSEERY
jgi:hypothetical protein